MDDTDTTPPADDTAPLEASDAELIARTRAGDSGAYEQLYARHYPAAKRLAWRYTRQHADCEDLVSTVFASILASMQAGHGPTEVFRPYLLTCVRRLGGRYATREFVMGLDPDDVLVDERGDYSGAGRLDAMLAFDAFSSLPERQRLALWHAIVEGDSLHTVASFLGVSDASASVIVHRAKENLRQAFLAKHMGIPRDLPACEVTPEQLAALVRGTPGARTTKRLTEHVRTCPTCQARILEARHVEAGMRLLVAPAILGVSVTEYVRGPHGPGAVWSAHRAAFLGGAAVVVAALALWLALSPAPDAAPGAALTPAATSPVGTTGAAQAAGAASGAEDAAEGVPALDALPTGQAPQPDTATHGAVSVSQPYIPQLFPGEAATVKITLDPGGAPGMVHVRLPEHVTVQDGALTGSCTVAAGGELVCGPFTAGSTLNVPAQLDATVAPGSALTDGAAWVADASGSVLAGPIRVSVQVHHNPCCTTPAAR